MLQHALRKPAGQAMPLVIACLLILTMGAFAAMQFGVLNGGSLQVRNAVDSGALNVAAHATDMQVKPAPAFSDVANTSGQISLTNINRVFGKALLINLNAESMKKSGQSGQSQGNAQLAFTEANDVAQQLVNSLADGQFLNNTFSMVNSDNSSSTSHSGSGNGSSGSANGGKGTKAASHFGTGYVHSGQTSNISANSSQFPPLTNEPTNGKHLPGYTALSANGKQFYLVPFKQGEKPHLISTEEFNGSAAPANWESPVPNAFQARGQLGPDVGIQSVASAVANGQQNYQLAIPHAFVDIRLVQTQVTCLVNGKKAGSTTYGTTPQTQFAVKKFPVGCKSVLNGYASVGNEYKGGTVLSAIEGVNGTVAHQQAFKLLAQRLSEISRGFSVAQLQKMLMQQQLVANVTDYIIYPVYKTGDNTDPKIEMSPISQVNAGWFNPGATADGTAKSLGSESLQDSPNSNWGQVIGAWKLQAHHVNVTGQVMWTPGSGYNQNLGMLELSRSAQVTFTGSCP